MMGFEREFLTEWRRLKIAPDRPLVAGVSGGADSLAMLYAATSLSDKGKVANQVVAAHFNHCLRGAAADSDAELVAAHAASLKVELVTGKADEATASGNLEQLARRARYGFLERTAKSKKASAILIGHTVNDRAETLLMNLLRGSGIEGLGAMPVVRETSPGSRIFVIRPMLRWATREMTEEYCASRGIEFSTDAMNEDRSFTRVKIRKELIPQLKNYNPNIVDILSSTAERLEMQGAALKILLSDSPAVGAALESGRLPIRTLRELPRAIRGAVVREWLRSQRGDLKRIDSRHVESILALAFSTKSGKQVELPGKHIVSKVSGKLVLGDQ